MAAASLKSWVAVAPDSEFPIQNLPYGVFKTNDSNTPHIGIAIGEYVLDLHVLATENVFSSLGYIQGGKVFLEPTLNEFMALPRTAWQQTRACLTDLLLEDTPTLRDNKPLAARALLLQSSVQMVLPANIGDYTDFYSSRNHAYNVGVMFRGPANALQPNWNHLPVGYHGRSSSVVISGVDVRRPYGQVAKDDATPPEYTSCKTLDFELEVGVFIGGPANELGQPHTISEIEDRLFGMVLLNDWSARDIQRWEYVPLGPFTAKNFATTISPWIVTFDALEPFIVAGEEQNPKPLQYLAEKTNPPPVHNIDLEVYLKSENMTKPSKLAVSNTKYLYWTFKQQAVHHTVTGCNLRPGDLLGSGTISGKEPHEYGSMLELSWKGTKEIPIEGETSSASADDKPGVRKFIRDGDEIIFHGIAQDPSIPYRIGFGECRGKILPAKPLQFSS